MQKNRSILIEIFYDLTVLCRFDSAASSSETEDSDGDERPKKKKKDIKRKSERKHKEPIAKKSKEVCRDFFCKPFFFIVLSFYSVFLL